MTLFPDYWTLTDTCSVDIPVADESEADIEFRFFNSRIKSNISEASRLYGCTEASSLE
jgi:hypothetical protein